MCRLVERLYPLIPSSMGTRAGVLGFSMGLRVAKFLLLVCLLERSLFAGVVGSGFSEVRGRRGVVIRVSLEPTALDSALPTVYWVGEPFRLGMVSPKAITLATKTRITYKAVSLLKKQSTLAIQRNLSTVDTIGTKVFGSTIYRMGHG